MSGSHSSSDDSNDSRKRPPEEILYPDFNPKRANCDEIVHLKVLIPSIAVGAVIGKAGEAIGKIQKDTNTKVKISKQDEFYPGTTERVCLIIGSIDGVMCVNNYIMDRILEKPDPNPHATCEGRLNVERHKQVKILVPNSTAGMVIGKGGSYIQEIKDKTGAYVQLSQKSREFNLLERCIIIAGDLDQTRAAVRIVLAVIASDPQSASCPNLSYHDIRGPVASVYPTGSPYATPIAPCSINPSWLTSASLDPASATAMMAAMLSARSLAPVGSLQAVQNAAFGLLSSTNYTTSDLSSLTADNQTLGLTPALLRSPAAAFLGPSGPEPPNLIQQLPFAVDPSQPEMGTAIDHAMAVAAAQQAALLAASFRTKSGSEVQVTESPALSSTMGPQSSILPATVMSYTPELQTQQLQPHPRMGARSGPLYLDSRTPGTSSAQSTTSSPSLAPTVAVAALPAVNSPPTFLSNPGAFLGVVPHPGVASTSFNVHNLAATASRSDSIPPTLSAASPLFFPLGDVSYSIGSYAGTTATAQAPMLSLYAMQNPGSPPLSTNMGAYWCRKIISVPESVIGLILGPQGRSVIDLQTASGTSIQISQKGVYFPGTTNRLVTITGPPLNVQWIANVIDQRVSFEQLRRESMSSNQSGSSPLLLSADTEDSQRKQSVFFNLPVTCASVYSTSQTPFTQPSSSLNLETKPLAGQSMGQQKSD